MGDFDAVNDVYALANVRVGPARGSRLRAVLQDMRRAVKRAERQAPGDPLDYKRIVEVAPQEIKDGEQAGAVG